MEINRDTVNQWLIEQRRSQTWLSEKCGVSKQAVSNWLRENNPQQISAVAQITIRSLMEEDEASAQSAPPHNLVLEFDSLEYETIENAALKQQVTVREWAKKTLNAAAEIDAETIEEIISIHHSVSNKKVADDLYADHPVSKGPTTYPKGNSRKKFLPEKTDTAEEA
jgi:predicted transcriptional regulator